ncbi:MAG TPA: hypothetical protein VNT51_05795 [Miltoncostaeaceae bacterium]|nr:hypothetical protein [Miltoncostaeaceae bacterium]
MPGPPPKHPSQRRRRNADGAAALGVTRLPREGRSERKPALPKRRPDGKAWSAVARSWWRTAWSSPMAAVWIEADVPSLLRLAMLVDDQANGVEVVDGEGAAHVVPVAVTVLGEIRQLEDRFGLSPLARRRLQWEIAQAEKDEGAVLSPTTAQAERWLRVASD